jgi:integrase
VQLFFKNIDNDKFRLLFSYQAQLGLRIGEVVKINIRDIDFQSRELTLKTEKSKVMNTLLIPIPLFRFTIEFIKANDAKIGQAGGFIFFKEDGKYSHREEPYLCSDYIRKNFRLYVQRAGLDKTYDFSDESNYDRTPRSLHRLTTHSLRHYAITSFARQTNGNVVLTSKFARHRSPGVTMTYISTTKQELYKEIDNAFSVEQVDKLKRSILSKAMER